MLLLNMKLLSQCQGLLRSGRQTSRPELFMTVRKKTRGGAKWTKWTEEAPCSSSRLLVTEPRSSGVMRSLPVARAWSQEGGTGNPLPDRFLSIYTVTQSDHAINNLVLLQKKNCSLFPLID